MHGDQIPHPREGKGVKCPPSHIFIQDHPITHWIKTLIVSVEVRKILKEFPEAKQVDKETPYNERRKMGHFSWAVSKSLEKVVVNLYVVHKVSKQTSHYN